MYLDLNDHEGAGPLGFLYLARAVLNSSRIQTAIKDEDSALNSYFELVKMFEDKAWLELPDRIKSRNRCYEYLYHRIADEKARKIREDRGKQIPQLVNSKKTIRHFKWDKDQVGTEALTITVVGPTRSGKTTTTRSTSESIASL